MSRRTSEADKAIRQAWKNEQDLVREGKCTRDWTPDQQRDILENGKAYDENGKAFEGHHMKSAEAYPEYQGDPENIQFLTRDEHKDAHQGNFQNPTNGYYDPETGETTDFGEGKYEPCEINDLSEPVAIQDENIDGQEAEENEEEADDLAENEGDEEASDLIADENTHESAEEEQAGDLYEDEGTEESAEEEEVSDLVESTDESTSEGESESNEEGESYSY